MSAPKSFTLLVKPNSDRCNLDCSYCFYKDSRHHGRAPRMSVIEASAMIQGYRLVSEAESYVWQGGEPMDRGHGFYHGMMPAQSDSAQNTMQTNGIKIGGSFDPQWVRLFKERGNWIVGLSHDGPTNKKRGIAQAFIDSAAKNLRNEEIPFSILCVVSEENIGNPRGVVEHFYRDEFADAPIQFIRAKGSSVTGHQFAVFLGEALGRTPDSGKRLANYFVYDAAWHSDHVSCETLPVCESHLMIDSNRIYPCDHFNTEEWQLAHIFLPYYSDQWADALRESWNSPTMRRFQALKTTKNKLCEPCSVREACNCGCPADYNDAGLSVNCAAHSLCAHITHPARAGANQHTGMQ